MTVVHPRLRSASSQMAGGARQRGRWTRSPKCGEVLGGSIAGKDRPPRPRCATPLPPLPGVRRRGPQPALTSKPRCSGQSFKPSRRAAEAGARFRQRSRAQPLLAMVQVVGLGTPPGRQFRGKRGVDEPGDSRSVCAAGIPLQGKRHVSAGHALLFGSTEESVSELPLDPRSAPCHGTPARRWTPRSIAQGSSLVRGGRTGQIGCLAAGDEMVPSHQSNDHRLRHGSFGFFNRAEECLSELLVFRVLPRCQHGGTERRSRTARGERRGGLHGISGHGADRA